MSEPIVVSGKPGRSLVIVHGCDFKPAAQDFMDITLAALSAGIERDNPGMLEDFLALTKYLNYYGDLNNEILTGKGRQYDERLDVGDRRNALQKLKAIERKKNFGVNRYDRLPGKSALAEFAADIAVPVLGSIGLSKAIIAGVAADVAEYWRPGNELAGAIRERTRAILSTVLERENKILLVSHGTGSIITYDVLWQLSHDPEYRKNPEELKIDTWLTLGSPLGDSMVKRRLLGAKEKGPQRYPSNVITWQNVSAEDDYFAHDNTLADDYKPMLTQRQVSSIRDYRIYNMCIRYGQSNPHSSLGYLIHPRVAQIVCDWLSQTLDDPIHKDIL